MNKLRLSFHKVCFHNIRIRPVIMLLILFASYSYPQRMTAPNDQSLLTQSILVKAGWNLLSLPVSSADNRKQSLFPTATSSAFIYQGGYQAQDTLHTGVGFWLKFDSSETIIVVGEPVYTDTIGVHDGWNMISCVAVPIPVSNLVSLPPDNIISEYFRYDGVYQNSDSLQPGCGYWVKVKQSGSIVFQFQAPAIPSNIYPIHESIGQPTSLTLRWTCENTNGDPLTYNVYFDTVNPPVSIVASNQSDTSLVRIDLNAGTTYYWKVVAMDNHGGSSGSPVWDFTTNHWPSIPSNPNPVDSALGQHTNVTLQWTSHDLDGEQLRYDVYFGMDNPPMTMVSSAQLDTFSYRTALIAGSIYYWNIVVKDTHGDSTIGPVWRFTTNNPPSAPSIVGPADSATGQRTSVVLQWTCTDPDNDPIVYDVYFGTENPPPTPVSSVGSDTFLFRSGLMTGTTYYWSVVAKDAHGDSAGSPVWRFTTNIPPNVPSIINPVDSAIGQSTTVTLNWSDIDPDGDPLTYDVYIGSGDPPLFTVTSVHADTFMVQGDLLSGTNYYWKIVAKDSKDDSTESPVWMFTTMGAPCPGVATVEYDGATYHTVQIGSQCWLRENLNVGSMVDRLAEQTNNSTVEKYCYNNDTANCSLYGGLYQWNEAMQYVNTPGAQGICPSGWHIPTHDDVVYVRSTVDSNGNALKAIGQGSGPGSGTNTSGFSALIGGYRYPDGYFYDLGIYVGFWGSTEYDPDILVTRFTLDGNSSNIDIVQSLKDYGFNVRCIKD